MKSALSLSFSLCSSSLCLCKRKHRVRRRASQEEGDRRRRGRLQRLHRAFLLGFARPRRDDTSAASETSLQSKSPRLQTSKVTLFCRLHHIWKEFHLKRMICKTVTDDERSTSAADICSREFTVFIIVFKCLRTTGSFRRC